MACLSCCVASNNGLFSSTGKDELLDTAMALHEAAMKDEYFIKRRLAPNVDFWSVLSVITKYYFCCNVNVTRAGGKLNAVEILLYRLTVDTSGLIYRAMG